MALAIHETLTFHFQENFMKRISTSFATTAAVISLPLVMLTVAVATGCDKAADDQQKANHAQAEADDKIATAKKEAAEKVNGAQATADKKIAEASADFGKRREDFRHKVETDTLALDKKIDGLEAKAKTATGKAKADLDASLTQIRARRTAFGATNKSLESATASTWDDAKARVEKEWTELQALVDKS